MKTIANLKDSVSGMLQGLNLNNVKNLYTAFERAARITASLIDLPMVGGRSSVTLYDGVTDYTAPTDIFGSTLYDFQYQGEIRGLTDYVYKQQISNFDRTKAFIPNGTQITFEYRNGVGRMRIVNARAIPKIVLDTMTETTGWTAAGSASSLIKDETIMWQSPASLRFNLTGASTGTLTKTISSQDLTDYVGIGVVFLAFRAADVTNLTSFSIKLGSSASAYYQVSSVTTGFLGAWYSGDWLLVALDLANATTVGSPTVTTITYCQLSITTAGSISNFYVGGLWISLPFPATLIYGSTKFFVNGSNTPSQSITDNTDMIMLQDDAYAIYETVCAVEIAEQQGGSLASGVVATLDQKINGVRGYRGVLIQPGLLDIYRANNPSQKIQTIQNYYYD